MNKRSRVKNTIRNLFVGFGGLLIHYILSFATRTIFVLLLSVEYLGVNGLFTNILAILSLAELGVGGAFVSLLYKPLHEEDVEKLKSLMTAYKKAYMLIGLIVAITGLAFYPFLDLFIKESNIKDIHLIYLMFLTGSVTSYFYAHKIDFIKSDQNSYISTIYSKTSSVIQYVLQILVLLLTKNFIIYLSIQIICPIVSNFLLARKVNRLYPFLREKGVPLDKETFLDLRRMVYAGMCHHFGYVIVTGTDSIVISTFLGVYWVGIYSNYLLILGVIIAFINLAFNSVAASVGNLTVSSDRAKNYEIFRRMHFLNFILVGFSAICLATLFNPFITLWIGSKYILKQSTVILIVLMFYTGLYGMQKSINTFKDVAGLFYNDRYAALAEGIINLFLSIYLVKQIGINGVFLGTIIAAAATRLWIEPYIVFKHLFRRSLMDYFSNYLIYGATTAFCGFTVFFITNLIPHENWIGFFAMAISCALLTVIIFTLFFFRTQEFNYFYRFIAAGTRKLKNTILANHES